MSSKLGPIPPLFSIETQTSANAYATFLTAYVYPYVNKIVYVKENNINAVSYSVDGTVDGTNWVNLVTDQPVLKNGDAYSTFTEPWVKLRVQVKSTVAATHSTDFDVWISVNQP